VLITAIFDKLSSRPATALRLAGLLGFLYWQSQSPDPAGFHGRGLAISVMLAGAAIAWVAWSWTIGESWSSDRGLSWDVLLMAICGGLMIGASTSGPANVFVFVAAFTGGSRVGLPRGLLVTGLATCALCISWVVYDVGGLGVLAYVLGLVATTLGGAQRHDATFRRDQAELLLAQTQRSHEEQLRNLKLQESSRMAREIHDVLAHSLAGLTIQLEATAALIEGGADTAVILPRVRRAHELAREGLRETRLAVGALREEGASVVPAASRIEALVGDFRASGHAIELSLDGAREQLAGPSGDASVRIIQEALTNVTKHAPAAAVSVQVAAGPPLRVAILSRSSDGALVPHASLSGTGGGYGIAGMRERAEELGGRCSAGPTPEGWLVEAELPAGALAPADREARVEAGP
jgi:signal transduction histidine kinase